MWHTPVAHWGREVPVCLGFSRVCGGEELAWHLRVYQKQDRVRYADDRPRLLAEQDPRGQIERMGGDHDEVCRFERQRAVRDPGRRAEKQWMRGAPGDPCWRLWHGYLLLARGRAIRVSPIAGAIGHGGGVAAGICAVNNINVQDIDIEELRKELKKQGAFI